MTWLDVPWGAVLTFVGLVSAVLLLALETRLRGRFAERGEVFDANGKPKFCSRDAVNGITQRIDRDLDGLGKKVDRNAGLFVSLDDRVGDLEEKTALLEERQSQQWERISEQMSQTAQTIREVTAELKEISKMQQEFALQLERMRTEGRPRAE